MAGKMKGWYIVAGVLTAVAIALACIPTHTYEAKIKETEDEIVGKATADEKIDAGGLIIVGQTKQGSYKFNRIFGGTNYKGEVSKYEAEHPTLGYQTLEDALNERDLAHDFEPLVVSSEVKASIYDGKKGRDFITVFGSTDFETYYPIVEDVFEISGVEVAGVIKDYYLLLWYPDTDIFFLLDYSDMIFSENRWKEQLYHIGNGHTFSLFKEYCKEEVIDGKTVYFVGSNLDNADLEWRASSEMELPEILR